MIRVTRFVITSFLLIAGFIVVPSGLLRISLGQDDKRHGKVKPPDKPQVETVVEAGDASALRCRGHILHGANDKKQKH